MMIFLYMLQFLLSPQYNILLSTPGRRSCHKDKASQVSPIQRVVKYSCTCQGQGEGRKSQLGSRDSAAARGRPCPH